MKKYSLPFSGPVKKPPAPFHRIFPNSRHCIDFQLPIGTPICAARGGIIVFRESRFNKSFRNRHLARRANVVIVKHADGEESFYAHLAWRSIRVAVGQKVDRGHVLALSGQTGFATYPHLHFGVYKNGKNIRIKFKEKSG